MIQNTNVDYNSDTYGGSLTAKITFAIISIEGKLKLDYSDATNNTIEGSTVEVLRNSVCLI